MVFRRKRKRDDDYENDEEENKKTKSRRIRDLKPENRKRRKEPPKPWGKKERILVLVCLIATVGTSAVLAISSRELKLPGVPRLQLPSFSLPFFGEETIVIEGNRERAKEREESEEVIKAFNEKTKSLSGVYGFYVVNLESGFSYGVNETEVFEPASLNKLPVMVGMYMEEESGSLSLTTKYKLKSEDKTIGAGSLDRKPEGYELTYEDLIRYMGKESDNTAFTIAKNILSEEKVKQIIAEIGMGETVTFGEEQKTTPVDIGVFFQELWQGNLISGSHRDELLGYLTDTVYESLIPEGVPDNIRVAHKYGAETNVLNDAGIIYTDEPFVLVMMGKGVVKREADEFFPEFAEMIYQVQMQD